MPTEPKVLTVAMWTIGVGLLIFAWIGFGRWLYLRDDVAATPAPAAAAALAPPTPAPPTGGSGAPEPTLREALIAELVRAEREVLAERARAAAETQPVATTASLPAAAEAPLTDRMVEAMQPGRDLDIAIGLFTGSPADQQDAARQALRKNRLVGGLRNRGKAAARAGNLRDAAGAFHLSHLLTGRPSLADVQDWRTRATNAERWATGLQGLMLGASTPSGVHVSVRAVRVRKYIYGGYLTYSQSGDVRFAILDLVIRNASGAVRHVNPLHFTETVCGQDVNPSDASYALKNALEATDVSPGSFVAGSIVFPIVLTCENTVLHYRDFLDSVDLPLGLPWKAAP